MADTITVLANVSVLVFVVSSMLAMGLSLTVKQIVDPLRDIKLVLLALLANFVLVPLVAYLIRLIIPLDEAFGIGLILLATAAGAPFLPKLAQAAKGNIAFSVGLMVLLMVVTVVYVPIVLPLLLPGVSVNPLDIASSLIVLMLIPLGVGLFIRARYAETAMSLQPLFAQASSTALLFVFGFMMLLNWRTILGTIGSGALIAAVLFIAISLAIGYFLASRDPGMRSVSGLGTAQRNVSAAMVVAAGNFSDPNVLVMILIGALLMLVILMPLGGELGKQQAAMAPAAAGEDHP
ncbi:MAG: bile acid:sodium symporter family protein [Anaerolineae bacterium]|jgi:predicted Na+-dependent transporter